MSHVEMTPLNSVVIVGTVESLSLITALLDRSEEVKPLALTSFEANLKMCEYVPQKRPKQYWKSRFERRFKL